MEHYVTLFDSLFLPQGLALHLSMERHAGQYTLWVLCVDDSVFDTLKRMSLPNVRLLRLSELETAELTRVKADRTRAEYCWTLTPFTPRFVFEADATVQRVTYIDADMWLRKNPAPIFRELETSNKHVLITDHSYAPEYDSSYLSGQYCVQFMVFTRTDGEAVRKWWEERCIEWCYSRIEDGKFGDQKYLDDWLDRFPNEVHALSDNELLLAPWNATRFPYGRSVCWHFHSLRIVAMDSSGRLGVDCCDYPLPQVTRRYVYEQYVSDLRHVKAMIEQTGGVVREQKKIIRTLKSRLIDTLHLLLKIRNRDSTSRYLPI